MNNELITRSLPALVALAITTLGLARAAEASRLQALVATSGAGVEKLLDGKPATHWRPVGDAKGEGVLFRFESATAINGLRLTTCGAEFDVDLYLNGTQVEAGRTVGGAPGTFIAYAGERQVRSAFVKLRATKACLAEVQFTRNGKPLSVEPPRVVAGEVVATSTLTPADAYHVSFLFDKRDDFGWVEGAKGLGVGEKLTVSFAAPTEVVALEIWNGYQRSKDHFRKNARVATLSVAADGGAASLIKVPDSMGPSKIVLPNKLKAHKLTLTIASAIEGKRYPDLVISELRFWDGAGPFSVATPDDERRQKSLLAEVSGKALAPLLDSQWVNYCDEGPDRQSSLKLRSNGSFVYYSSSEKDWGQKEAKQVFEGAWVMAKNDAGFAQVKLYGRKHLIATTWQPYRGKSEKETTRVAGGTLLLTPAKALGFAGLVERVSPWPLGEAAPSCERLNELSETDFQWLLDRHGVVVESKAILGLFYAKP